MVATSAAAALPCPPLPRPRYAYGACATRPTNAANSLVKFDNQGRSCKVRLTLAGQLEGIVGETGHARAAAAAPLAPGCPERPGRRQAPAAGLFETLPSRHCSTPTQHMLC